MDEPRLDDLDSMASRGGREQEAAKVLYRHTDLLLRVVRLHWQGWPEALNQFMAEGDFTRLHDAYHKAKKGVLLRTDDTPYPVLRAPDCSTWVWALLAALLTGKPARRRCSIEPTMQGSAML